MKGWRAAANEGSESGVRVEGRRVVHAIGLGFFCWLIFVGFFHWLIFVGFFLCFVDGCVGAGGSLSTRIFWFMAAQCEVGGSIKEILQKTK